jgi:hypothetical protein
VAVDWMGASAMSLFLDRAGLARTSPPGGARGES